MMSFWSGSEGVGLYLEQHIHDLLKKKILRVHECSCIVTSPVDVWCATGLHSWSHRVFFVYKTMFWNVLLLLCWLYIAVSLIIFSIVFAVNIERCLCCCLSSVFEQLPLKFQRSQISFKYTCMHKLVIIGIFLQWLFSCCVCVLTNVFDYLFLQIF